ncbi:hypothetical protein V6N13_084444 [Hibiscus sabdariffa]
MRNSCGLTASKDSAVGFQGGRPPDGTVCFAESDILERTGSPIPSDVQPLQKKGRSVDDRISDEMMAVDEGGQGDSQSKGESGMARGMGAGNPAMPMMSFRDMLIGDKGNKEISELDVEEACGKEDVVVENVAAVKEVTRDPKDLYGPWMQVVNRGRRPVGSRGFGASNVGRGRSGVLPGSRFAVLEEDMGQAGGIMDAVRVEGESRDQVDETIPVEKVGNTSSGAAAGTMPMRAGSIRRVDIGNGAGSSVAPRQTGGVENDEMRVVEESGQGDMVDFAARGLVVGAKTTLDSVGEGRVRIGECGLLFGVGYYGNCDAP